MLPQVSTKLFTWRSKLVRSSTCLVMLLTVDRFPCASLTGIDIELRLSERSLELSAYGFSHKLLTCANAYLKYIGGYSVSPVRQTISDRFLSVVIPRCCLWNSSI